MENDQHSSGIHDQNAKKSVTHPAPWRDETDYSKAGGSRNGPQERKHPLEWLIFGFVVLTFCATATAAWYARKQWVTADDTEKRQLRAYVFISGGSFDDVRTTSSPVGKLELKNSGQTPAYNVCSSLGAVFAPYPLNIPLKPPKYRSLGMLPPGVQESMIVDFPRPLTDVERNGLLAGKLAVYLHGTARFEDAFGAYWCVDYLFIYHIDGPHDSRLTTVSPYSMGKNEYRCDEAQDFFCSPSAL